MYKDILFPIDVNEDSSWRIALPVAVEYATAFGSKLHVVTVIPDYGMSIVSQYFPKNSDETIIKAMTEKLHEFTKENIPETIPVQHIITQGTVYEAIIDAANKVDADLIVMAAHRPELKDYLLGPNSARVVRHSDRSVLVVRDNK